MKQLSTLLTIAVIIIILAVLSGFIYFVDETKQVVVTQFGEPIGDPITEAGMHFKTPFIQKANYFEKRILRWDGDPNQIPTRDKRYIQVDTTARWRIVDPLKFMQTVVNESGAYARLDDIVDADVRDVISSHNLVETVRNSNRLAENRKKATEETALFEIETGTIERIQTGREALTREMLRRSSEVLPEYGIELIDVRIKRLNYIEDVRKKVYDRMISERKRASERYRSEGQGRKAEIEGQMQKELEQITSEAYRQAQEIKGKADGEAIDIYADAFGKDPEFYAFFRTLDTYKKTVNEKTDLILTTDGEYYRYIKSIDGNSPDLSQ